MVGTSRCFVAALSSALALASACGPAAPAGDVNTTAVPVYNKQTGRLEQLVSDRDHDGRPDTWAYMDGVTVKYIEIDRSGDGKPDRWEYYTPVPAGGARVVIDHAEEANGLTGRITRREFYADGTIRRVEEDTNDDGRADKWEQYEAGVLAKVELDLLGKGYASQRLVYGPDGNVTRIETDPDGDGVFVPVSAPGKDGK